MKSKFYLFIFSLFLMLHGIYINNISSAQSITWYHIVSTFDGQCIWPSGLSQGNTVQTTACADFPRQQWYFPYAGTGQYGSYYLIVNRKTGLCLDLKDGNPATGAQYQLWTCDANNSNQQFYVFEVDSAGGDQIMSVLTELCVSKENPYSTIKQRDCSMHNTRIWYLDSEI